MKPHNLAGLTRIAAEPILYLLLFQFSAQPREKPQTGFLSAFRDRR
jgi:hypothetical protein